jgi:hypothetical protein
MNYRCESKQNAFPFGLTASRRAYGFKIRSIIRYLSFDSPERNTEEETNAQPGSAAGSCRMEQDRGAAASVESITS